MSDSVFGAPTDTTSEHPLVRFATERPLSRSPLANAWLAIDSTSGARVLLKQFSTAFNAFIEDREQYTRRIEHVAACNDPHLARLHWLSWHDDRFYVAFTWQEHDPLDQFVAASQNRMPMAQRYALVRAAARAVDVLHANGLLHLALTPTSFGVDQAPDRQVRLIDWGLMLPGDSTDRADAAFPGVWMDAAPYASAELLTNGRPDTSDDVYSFSCIAHEVLSGEHPFGRRPARDALAMSMPPRAIADLAAPQVDALAEGLALQRSARATRLGAIINAFSVAPPREAEHAAEATADAAISPQRNWRTLAVLGLAVIAAFVLVWRSTLHPTSMEHDARGYRAEARSASTVPAPQSGTQTRGVQGQGRTSEAKGGSIPAAPTGIPGMPGSAPREKPAESAVSAKAGDASAPSAAESAEERAPVTAPSAAAPVSATDRAGSQTTAAKNVEPASRTAATDGVSADAKLPAQGSQTANVGECRHCDCATLEYKRTFTTDPVRPEEQRFLARNCKR